MKKYLLIFLKIILSLSMVWVILILALKIEFLPFKLEFERIPTCYPYEYAIYEKNGFPIIEEGYFAIFNQNSGPKIKKLLKYKTNDLGLIIYFEAENGIHFYTAISPKNENKYPQSFNYFLYTKAEYEKLHKYNWWWWNFFR